MMALFLTKEKTEDKKKGSSSIVTVDQIHDIGVLGSVVDLQSSGKLSQIVMTGIRRIKVLEQVPDMPRLTVKVEDLVCDPFDATSTVFKAYCQEIISTLREITSRDHGFREQLHALSEQVDISNPVELADLVAAIVCERADAQRVLEATDVSERMLPFRRLHWWLMKPWRGDGWERSVFCELVGSIQTCTRELVSLYQSLDHYSSSHQFLWERGPQLLLAVDLYTKHLDTARC